MKNHKTNSHFLHEKNEFPRWNQVGINSTTGASCLTVGVGVSEPLWADLGSFEASAVHLWPSLYSFTEGHVLHLLPRVLLALLASSASFSSDTVGSSDLYLGLSRFCSCFCTSTDLRHLPFVSSAEVLLVTLQSIMMTPFFNMMIKLSLGVERLFDFLFLTRLLVGCLLLPPFCHVICRGLLRIHLFTMLFLLLASILVPKRFKWVCREALYSLVTPGHLL